MTRGWEAEFKDGTVIDEEKCEWTALANKKDIVRLTLRWDGRRWDIRNKEAYIQKKRAMSIPGCPEIFIMARYIGYYEGNKKVLYKVDETSGKMTLEVIEG